MRKTQKRVSVFAYNDAATMADLLDAIEFDWPRWGRRILISRSIPRDPEAGSVRSLLAQRMRRDAT